MAQVAKSLGGSVFAIVLWTSWLALGLLIVLQLYIRSAHELAIPGFALRVIEGKLAEAGLHATFKRTSFDPTGRVLIQGFQATLPSYHEPVLTARAVFVQLNPLSLVVGKFEPDEIRIMGAGVWVPALLSPTGRSEEIVQDLEVIVRPSRGQLWVRQLNARVAGVKISADGVVPLPKISSTPGQMPFADLIEKQFPGFCRNATALAGQLAQFEEPLLRAEFAPSESGAIALTLIALARAVKMENPLAAQASHLRATTRLLFFGDTPATQLEISADEISLPPEGKARGIHATLVGRFRPNERQIELREVRATVDAIAVAGVNAQAVSGQFFPRPLPRLDAVLVARIFEAPLAVRAEGDLEERRARVHFSGAIAPAVLDVVSQRVGTDVRKFYEFEALTVERGDATFGADWKFEKLSAQVRVPRMNSYGIIMENGRASVELDPRRFYAPTASAQVGENFARGSYEHQFADHRFRFILEGRLRPMAISGWFRDWWPNFFRQFEFSGDPPAANVDVAGTWRDGRQSTVFVFAEVAKSILRNTAFDYVRTRLFIRPDYFDGLEILARHGAGEAHGTFTLLADAVSHEQQSLEFGLVSSLDLATAAQILGPAGARLLAPYQIASAPELKLQGRFAGPAAPAGARDHLRIEARTAGEFRFHQFPVQDLSFVATLDGDEIVLDNIVAGFGGGIANGHARVWGAGTQRRLGFDFSLQDATLGQVIGKLQAFFALQKNQPPPPPGKFVQEKAGVRLDIAASAEGRYDDPLTFRGDGNVALRGAEIGEVPLLGQLSELFKFTALRFTEARANFKLEGPRLVFPKVELRGANSAIDAHGEYGFDRKELAFNAKVFPFHESDSLFKSVVGAVLTPLSNALEVKLTGSLEKPQWVFVNGPANLLRGRTDNGDAEKKPDTVTGATPSDEKPPSPPGTPPSE